MAKLRETRNFHVHPAHTEAPHEELASEVISHAKGGHHVALNLPSGQTVDVHPEDDHATVTQKITEAMGPKDTAASAASRKKGSAIDA